MKASWEIVSQFSKEGIKNVLLTDILELVPRVGFRMLGDEKVPLFSNYIRPAIKEEIAKRAALRTRWWEAWDTYHARFGSRRETIGLCNVQGKREREIYIGQKTISELDVLLVESQLKTGKAFGGKEVNEIVLKRDMMCIQTYDPLKLSLGRRS